MLGRILNSVQLIGFVWGGVFLAVFIITLVCENSFLGKGLVLSKVEWLRCRKIIPLGFSECCHLHYVFCSRGRGGIPCFLKALDLHPQCLHWGDASSGDPFWGPLGVRVQGSRGSQVEFQYESVLCITSAFKALWRWKSAGDVKIYFPGWGVPQPPQQIPSPPHQWDLLAPSTDPTCTWTCPSCCPRTSDHRKQDLI